MLLVRAVANNGFRIIGPEGLWKLAGGASHRNESGKRLRPARAAEFRRTLQGAADCCGASGGLRHWQISSRPSGTQQPASRKQFLADAYCCLTGRSAAADFWIVAKSYKLDTGFPDKRRDSRIREGGDLSLALGEVNGLEVWRTIPWVA